MKTDSPLRAGVFIDGTYFGIVNKHYQDLPGLQKPIDHAGLLSFLQRQTAELLSVTRDGLTITRRHMYLGLPLGASISNMRWQQEAMLKVDIDLQHFPIKNNGGGIAKEQGVDVALAWDAGYESSKLDVYILITGDGDFIPLVDKLQSIGKKVILAYWHVGSEPGKTSRTNTDLIRSATHSVNMRQKIEVGLASGDKHICKIFGPNHQIPEAKPKKNGALEIFEGVILSQTTTGGRIRKIPIGNKKRTLVFFKEEVEGAPFKHFEPDRKVQFSIVYENNMKRAIHVKLIA